MEPQAAFPERTAIAIVGGGLSGWALAAALGEAARDAVLLEATSGIDPNDASLGIARAIPAMPFARLEASHGRGAVGCIIAGAANSSILQVLARLAPGMSLSPGVIRLAAAGPAAEELQRSAERYALVGGSVQIAPPSTFFRSPPERFALAVLHREDMTLDVSALLQLLRKRATKAGLRAFDSARVDALDDASEVRLTTSRGTLRAEIAVVATGAELPRLVPFCRFKIVGMRAQWLRADADPGPPPPTEPAAWTDSEGYELWRRLVDGTLVVSGSRNLPVKREIAARSGMSAEVQELLEANLREFPSLAKARIVARGSWVQAPSCDGLPLVGPVPGRPRIIVLGGFGREGPGTALVAAERVAQLILHGKSAYAAVYSPRRFM